MGDGDRIHNLPFINYLTKLIVIEDLSGITTYIKFHILIFGLGLRLGMILKTLKVFTDSFLTVFIIIIIIFW